MTHGDPYSDRLERAQTRMAEEDIDGLVLFPSVNLYYLTGFHEEPAERHFFLFLTPDDHAVVAPTMYLDQFQEEASLSEIYPWDDGEDPMAKTTEAMEEIGLTGTDGRVLLDDTMFALFSLDIQDVLPDAEFDLASSLLGEMRLVKDEYEIESLREAARISDEVSEAIRALGVDAVGMTERDLVNEMRKLFDERGGDGFSFEPIAGSGPKGAHPHYRYGDRTIGSGEPVILDFGTSVRGYPGDQTRTVVFDGKPPEDFHDIYDTVLEAFEAAVAAVQPGVEAQEVDRAARAVIEDAGYGEQFLHRTGHGLGLEVHEPPYIVEGNDQELAAGMVHSVEPGIYLEGRFGVRIEDIVVVTEDGCERLNDSTKTWKPLD